jgi:hypothetical protein
MTMPEAWGDEFLVNVTTSGNQRDPSIAALANGQFVAVWRTEFEIAARVYHADGSPAGGEIPVNTTTAGSQEQAAVIGLGDGRFLVTWLDFPSGDIIGRIFNLDGSPATAEFPIVAAANDIEMSSIAALPGGGFVATWQTDDANIQARTFDAAGVANPVFTVDANTASETEPVVAVLSNGNYVIVWQDAGSAGETDGSGSHIRARVCSGNGTFVSDEFIVNQTAAGDQVEPTVAARPDGSFVVCWEDDAGDDLRARVFSNNGTALANEFPVTSEGTQPSIVGLAGPGQFIAYTDPDSSGSGIGGALGQGNSGGTGIFHFTINDASGEQRRPAAATLADGRVVVLWSDFGQHPGDTSGSAVRGQIIEARLAHSLIEGTSLDDQLIGTAHTYDGKGFFGSDALDDGDILNGFAGDDVLDGDAGNDWLAGGREATLCSAAWVGISPGSRATAQTTR